MGLLDQLKNALSNTSGQEGAPEGTPAILAELLGGGSTGGVAGLVEKFQSAGLGDTISSWIGTGENQTISPEQIGQALGSEHAQQLAEKAGMPVEQLLSVLSQHLPTAVDALTPTGEVSSGSGLLETGLGMLKNKLT